MTTYYNIVYNGNLELDQGQREVEAAYIEDYWKVLPVERMATNRILKRKIVPQKILLLKMLKKKRLNLFKSTPCTWEEKNTTHK